jgi:hypothetical protein
VTRWAAQAERNNLLSSSAFRFAKLVRHVRFPPIAAVALQCSERRFVPTSDITPVVQNSKRGHQLRRPPLMILVLVP